MTYYDYFSTVVSTNENIAMENTRTHLFQFMSEDFQESSEIDNIPELDEEWLTPAELEARRRITPQPRMRIGLPSEDNVAREQPEEIDVVFVEDNQRELEEDSDEEELPQPEGVGRNPGRALRGINRRYQNNDFINFTYQE